jgi:hypothetical protein
MPPSEQQWSAPPADRYLADVAAGAGRRFHYRSRVGELLGRPAGSGARPHAPERLQPELLYRADAVRLAAEEDGWRIARPATASTTASLPYGPAPRAAVGPPAHPDTEGRAAVREILLPGPAAGGQPWTAPSSGGRQAISLRPDLGTGAALQSGSRPMTSAPASGGSAPAPPSPAPSPPPLARPGDPDPGQPGSAQTGAPLSGFALSGSPQPSAAPPEPGRPQRPGASEPGPSQPGGRMPSGLQESHRAASSPRGGGHPATGRAPLPAAVAARSAPPLPDPVAHPAIPPMADPRPATGSSTAAGPAPHAEPRVDSTAPGRKPVALRSVDRPPAGPDTPDAAAPARTGHRLRTTDPVPAPLPTSHRAEPPQRPSTTSRPIPPVAPAMPSRRPAPAQPSTVTTGPSNTAAASRSAPLAPRPARPAPAVQVSRRTATRAVSQWDRSSLRRVGLRGLR